MPSAPSTTKWPGSSVLTSEQVALSSAGPMCLWAGFGSRREGSLHLPGTAQHKRFVRASLLFSNLSRTIYTAFECIDRSVAKPQLRN